MKYMLMIYVNEAAMEAANPAAMGQVSSAFMAYTEAMKSAGILVGGDRLMPTKLATTIRGANGTAQVLDGPYAEAKEQLGGYYIIDVADLDAALSWASRCPRAPDGAVEVRPLAQMM